MQQNTFAMDKYGNANFYKYNVQNKEWMILNDQGTWCATSLAAETLSDFFTSTPECTLDLSKTNSVTLVTSTNIQTKLRNRQNFTEQSNDIETEKNTLLQLDTHSAIYWD